MNKKILICDDEEGLRESFKLILAEKYTLNFATNGLEALQMLEKETPNLLILDIKMPKVNGLDVLKKIKAKKPNLPVIIVTGYQSAEMAQEAIKSGAADYIAKPFESKEILNAVAKSI